MKYRNKSGSVCRERERKKASGSQKKHELCTSYISVPLTLATDDLPFIEKYLFSIDKRIQIMVKRQICRM